MPETTDNTTKATTKERKKRTKSAVIAKYIETTRGNVSACATALGVDRSSLHRRIKKEPQLLALLEAQRDVRLDYAESALDTALAKGEAWAVSLTLRTLGGERGYIERSHVMHDWKRDAERQGLDPSTIRAMVIESVRTRLQLADGGRVARGETIEADTTSSVDAEPSIPQS